MSGLLLLPVVDPVLFLLAFLWMWTTSDLRSHPPSLLRSKSHSDRPPAISELWF